jgi:hypothetical protein
MKNRDGSGVQFGGESIVKDTGMSEREKRPSSIILVVASKEGKRTSPKHLV